MARKKLSKGNDWTRRKDGTSEVNEGLMVLEGEAPVAQPVRPGLRSLTDLSGLIPVDTLLSSLKSAHSQMEYYEIDNPKHLGMTWDAVNKTYTGHFKGKDMPLSVSAVRTGCRFTHLTPDWLIGKPSERFIQNVMDQCVIHGGCQIATDGKKILAFVAPSFTFMSDWELVDGIVKSVIGKPIRGIEMTEHLDGDATDYRIVFGNSIIKKDEVFAMLSVTSSPFGIYQSAAQLGMWRVKCLNGTLSDVKSQRCKWNHRKGTVKFMDRMGALMSEADDYAFRCTALLERARATPLSTDAAYVTQAMYEMKLLKGGQYTAVADNVNMRVPRTAYDYWNVITDAAKGFDLNARHALEQQASIYLTRAPDVNKRALDLESPVAISQQRPKKKRK